MSFTKNKTNYESILQDDIIKTIKFNNHEYDSFFSEIIDGLSFIFSEDTIKPNRQELKRANNLD